MKEWGLVRDWNVHWELYVTLAVAWWAWTVWRHIRDFRPWKMRALRCYFCGRFVRDLTSDEMLRLHDDPERMIIATCHLSHSKVSLKP